MTNSDIQEIKDCIRSNAIGISAALGLIAGLLLMNSSSKVNNLQKSVDEIKAALVAQQQPTKVAGKTNDVLNVQHNNQNQKN